MFSHVADLSRNLKRLLVVRTDRLGDVVLTIPMLPVLRQSFPDASIAVLLRRYTGELLEGNPYVDKILWYDEDDHLVPFDIMCRTLRAERFDATIVVYPRFRLAWLMYRAGIPIRVGTGFRYYSMLFNRRVYEHRRDAKRHELEYNLTLLKELGCEVPEREFRPEFFIHIPAEIEQKVNELLGGLHVDPAQEILILHPGSGGSAREWPPASFGALASKIALARNALAIVTGGRGEEAKVQQVVAAAGGQAIPLVGKLSVKEFAALIRRARLFVSNSTGPLHLAVAVGTPVVGLYPQATAMSARRWGPYTDKAAVFVPHKPLDCNDCVRGNATPCTCMASISVEQVLGAAMVLLERQAVLSMESPLHA